LSKNSISLDSISPFSIKSTRPSPTFSIIFILLFKLADVFSNRSLCIVPLVAKTPILFVLVTKLAGFIAGSIPIKGMVYFL